MSFCVLLVALDAGVGALLRHYYFRQTWGLSFRTTYAIDDSNEDLVILGSSRAQANYVPEVFRAALGKTCYNAGRDGQSILYAKAVQAAILKRYRPSVIVLDLIPIDFYDYGRHYEVLSALLPYYRSHPEIRPIVETRSKAERIKLLSQIYPFNSLPLQIVRYNMTTGHEQNGHVPQFGELELPVPEKDMTAPTWVRGELDKNMLDALKSLGAACRASDVRLVVVVSPVYQGVLFGREALDEASRVLAGDDWKIWDYSDYSGLSDEAALFRDVGHLNNVGAQKFSELVAARIQNELAAAGTSPAP